MKKKKTVTRRLPYSRIAALLQGRTGKRHLRDEIRKRYDRYRELLEQSSEGIWRCELDEAIDIDLPKDQQIALMLERGYVAECNESMARMYGLESPSDLLGTRLNQIFVPENEQNYLFLSSFIDSNYRLSDVESVEQDKSGRVIYFRNNLIGIVKNRKLICAWGMQKDMTQEFEFREGLRRSEERLRMATEAGSVGIWEWNIATNELFWSDHVKQIYGFPPDKPVTMEAFRSAIHPDDREQSARRIAEAQNINNQTRFVSDHRILVAGQVKWVLGFGETFYDDTGRALRMSGTVIDVTESRMAERKSIQLRDAGLQLSKAMTLHELADIVIDFSAQTLGAKSIAIHGKREDESSLQPIRTQALSPGDLLALEKVALDVIHEGHALFAMEPRCRSVIPLILNQRTLGVLSLEFDSPQNFDQDFQRFVLTFSDQCAQTWERARLYEIEQAARKEAEAANQAKSRFLASVSHEIRTPLSAIIGFAELLTEDGVSDEERSDSLARILRNGHLLADMINDILDLAKIESEKLEVELIEFELTPLVQEVIALLQMKAQEKNIRLLMTAMGKVPKVLHSDPTRLRQILINLLGNAIKFTEQGRIEIHMNTEVSEQGHQQLRFTIVDTGVGIPSAQHSRIFEPFIQADSSTTRRFGGTGLGLAVSRGLAQALGGDLQLLKSAPGEGSTFSFTIKLGPHESAAPAFTEQTAHRKPSGPHELTGLRILVVDDNPDNRTYIGSFLTAAGATIETAANGRLALDLINQRDFDIVLMDIQMPELDGFGAMRQLRAQAYAKPVLALTAHAMTGDRESSLAAGFQDHLVKPIDRVNLIQAIRKYTSGTGRSGR